MWEKHVHVVNKINTKSTKILRKYYLSKTRLKAEIKELKEEMRRQPNKIKSEGRAQGKSRQDKRQRSWKGSVMGWIVSPQNLYVEVLTPGYLRIHPIGKSVFGIQ